MKKVVHFEIPAKDLKRAQDFYGSIFEWQLFPVPGIDTYVMVTTVETDQNQMPKESGAINGALTKDDAISSPVLVISVEDLNTYMEKVKQNGGKIVMEPIKVMEMGMYTRFKDPEGNILGLWQDLTKIS